MKKGKKVKHSGADGAPSYGAGVVVSSHEQSSGHRKRPEMLRVVTVEFAGDGTRKGKPLRRAVFEADLE